MGQKTDAFLEALQYFGDGRYKYYDGTLMSLGCSDYVRISLQRAGIIKPGDWLWAGQAQRGVLQNTSLFQYIPWNPAILQPLDILWSHGHHVAVWDGKKGVYEAAPERTHGICDNGKTGVGHWSHHGYYNCGTSSYTWSNIYRIIDTEQVKADVKKEIGKMDMDKAFNIREIVNFLPVIKYGTTGAGVRVLQKIMAKYGWYAGDIDGSAGPMTQAGIKTLQTALNITVDGIAGPQTWTALLS